VDDDRNGDIEDGQRQGWKLLKVLFQIEFYELTGATPPLALKNAKPNPSGRSKKRGSLRKRPWPS
jgi:hypothetical protein